MFFSESVFALACFLSFTVPHIFSHPNFRCTCPDIVAVLILVLSYQMDHWGLKNPPHAPTKINYKLLLKWYGLILITIMANSYIPYFFTCHIFPKLDTPCFEIAEWRKNIFPESSLPQPELTMAECSQVHASLTLSFQIQSSSFNSVTAAAKLAPAFGSAGPWVLSIGHDKAGGQALGRHLKIQRKDTSLYNMNNVKNSYLAQHFIHN